MSRFDINERIVEASTEFESVSGAAPRYVYLGFYEWEELRSYLSLVHGIDLRPASDKRAIHDSTAEGQMTRIGDSELLYVAKKSHLAVGS